MNAADTPRSVLADRFGLDPDAVDVEQFFAASWVLHLDAYRKAAAAGVPFALVRYNDLLASPREGTAQLFAVSGLAPDGIDAGLRAFEKDSQEGTAIARSSSAQKLSEEQIARAKALIGRQGAQYDPDIVL